MFYQHPKWFISLQTIETCGLLLLYNNSEDARFFRGFIVTTRRIFAFTRALCLGETLVLLDVVSQGLFGNDGLSCNCFCIGMLKLQGYYLSK